MKITGFCPLIVTNDSPMALDGRYQVAQAYDEAGNVAQEINLDADGNRINITSIEKIPRDLTGISINVDNFREAYDFLIARGFVNPRGDKVTDTSSSKATMLLAPSGFAVSISEHIKN